MFIDGSIFTAYVLTPGITWVDLVNVSVSVSLSGTAASTGRRCACCDFRTLDVYRYFVP